MKVFIAGATGVLGRALTRQLVERGHAAVGLVRNEQGAQVVRACGGESRTGDIFDAVSLTRAAEGADVVIHAATSIPTKARPRARDWEMNDRIRRDGTRALVTCAANVGAKLYLQQSIVWLARPADGSFFDELAEPRPDDITRSALYAETISREAGEAAGFKTGVLRCGLFYAPESAHTRAMGKMLRERKLPIIGSGDSLLSCLHVEDAAGAFVAAAEGGKGGLWHVVDDYNVTVREMLTGFSERLGAPPPRSVPVWLARLVAGRNAVEFFTSSVRTSNALFREEFGWSPRFPSYKEGLEQVVEKWKAEGFLSK